MFSFLKKIFGPTGAIIIELCLACFVLIILAGVGLVWRLTAEPLDLEFARAAIEDALRDDAQGLSVQSQRIVLYWPELRGPLLLGLEKGQVVHDSGQVILSVEEAALGLNKRRLLIGQIAPEALVLKKPSLNVTRRADNSFDIGLSGEQTAGDQDGDVGVIEEILSYLDDADDDARAPLAKLKRFEIQDAALFIKDEVLNLNWDAVTADAVFEPVDAGLRAQILVDLPFDDENTDVVEQPRLDADLILNQGSGNIDAKIFLTEMSPAVIAQKIPEAQILNTVDGLFNVQLEGLLDEQLVPQFFDLQMVSPQGGITHKDLGAATQPYRDFHLSARYEAQSGVFNIGKAGLVLGDVPFMANAEVTLADNFINASYRLEIDSVMQSSLGPLWPDALKEENAYEWVVEKLSDGQFSNAYIQGELALPKSQNDGWVFDEDEHLKNVRAGFEFVDMSVDYRAPLAPVTQARGRGEFILQEERLRIDIETAQILDMNVSAATLEFYNIIEAGKGTADVNITLNGALPSVLQYVSAEPLLVKPDFDVINARGEAALQINLGFPTNDVDLEDFDIDIAGTVQNAVIPRVLKDMTLNSPSFALTIDNDMLRIAGDGDLEGRPVSVSYEEFVTSQGKPYSSKVQAALNVDPELRRRFGMDLSAFLDGTARVDVVYTAFQDGRSEADVRTDLTQARLFVDPFDYEKRPGVSGQAQLKAILRDGELREIISLTGSTPELKLQNSRLFFRQRGAETELASGLIRGFSLGETQTGVKFEFEKSGRVKLVMEGAFLDLRPFLNSEDDVNTPYENPPMQISVSVNQMRTADDAVVRGGKIFADIDAQGKFNQLEMDGVAGAGDIYLRYKPDEQGKRVFRFEADDAGAALKAFDLYDNIRGGKMVIYGEPIRGVYDRNLIGRAELSNFRVVDAPTLARLLGVMSLPGVTQTLAGEGLVFTKLESNFDWRYRPQGSLLVLKDGRTSGNALGLTFDGTFDNARNFVDVKGTIIPLSGVNAAIGNIPLLGDLLTGGTGALIAATYTMKGEGKEPDVSVNPLSALTPGILRRILFEN